ncbi:DUF3794 domain-containing protein [Bacillus sp. HMF5848]|uniref:CsxC family protein n=1 Tax=Bacillus sp. HMF5848 TaxID=2495421 RepID=UPI000F7A25A5|nr:DUF3794 domain-containing protein [Bacillus sp. HMF5848]RSK27755.1 DUF3794 domain-containing protein [Bacillus sp. HMF5848]
MHKRDNNHCIDVNVSTSIEQCENDNIFPFRRSFPNSIFTTVPLTDLEVNTTLAADIHFPHPVLEIKDVKKRIKIVQCKLLLPSENFDNGFGNDQDFRLVIKGFVRKNFQYASPEPYSEGNKCVSSTMKSFTVDMPFQCVTTINEFANQPQLPIANSRNEFDFFRAQDLGTGHPEKDQFLSSDISQFHQDSTQVYNPFPFCEILFSRMTEYDEAIDRMPFKGNEPYEEGYFHTLSEKVFLRFGIRVLQKQLVSLNGFPPNGDNA